MIFVMRGLMSPFAHVMFTACTGLARLRRAPDVGSRGRPVLDPRPHPRDRAHAFWTGRCSSSTTLRVLLPGAVPMFLGIVALVVAAAQEAKLTRDRLVSTPRSWLPRRSTCSRLRAAARQAWAARTGRGPLMRPSRPRLASRGAPHHGCGGIGRRSTGAAAVRHLRDPRGTERGLLVPAVRPAGIQKLTSAAGRAASAASTHRHRGEHRDHRDRHARRSRPSGATMSAAASPTRSSAAVGRAGSWPRPSTIMQHRRWTAGLAMSNGLVA